MGEASPFSEEEYRQLREVAKDIISGGRVSSYNREHGAKWIPLIMATVPILDREGSALLALPYSGGFLDQPTRTLQAVTVVQNVFAEQLRKEYESKTKGVKRG